MYIISERPAETRGFINIAARRGAIHGGDISMNVQVAGPNKQELEEFDNKTSKTLVEMKAYDRLNLDQQRTVVSKLLVGTNCWLAFDDPNESSGR